MPKVGTGLPPRMPWWRKARPMLVVNAATVVSRSSSIVGLDDVLFVDWAWAELRAGSISFCTAAILVAASAPPTLFTDVAAQFSRSDRFNFLGWTAWDVPICPGV